MNLCETVIILKILSIFKKLFNLAKIVIPLVLIIFITIDTVKYILDPDQNKNVINKSIKRFIAAIIIFFVPMIVTAFLNLLFKNSTILTCINNANSSYIKVLESNEKERKAEEERKAQEKYQKELEEIEEKRRQEQENQKEQGEVLNNIELIDSKYPSRSYIYADGTKRNNITVNYYKGDKAFSYWMYVPEKVTTNLPLIVFIHGHGNPHGDDYNLPDNKLTNANGILYGPIRDAINNKNISYNAIIIQPQIPNDQGGYDYTSSYVQLISRIKEVYKINDKKISAMGVSHGCYVIVYFINKYPDYLSAAVPLACNPYSDDFKMNYGDYKNYTKTAFWAFVGSSGEGARDSHMPKFVNEINKAGGNAKYTYIPNSCHNIVNCDSNHNNYNLLNDTNYNIINWMISQTRK